jgi:MoaA/NifB/PqqE/SkfB family radical SAM enzyme
MKQEELTNSNSFCIMPWVHLATEPNGDTKICCLSNKRIRATGRNYNLGQDDVIEIYNSDQIKLNRKNMLEGVRIPECAHCWKEENSGGLSQRQGVTEQWLREYPELLEMIEESVKNDYHVDYAPMYYDFRFGNLCNLKCRSCGSLNSTQINKEYKELKEKHPTTTFFFDSGEKYETLNDWYKTEQFYNNVYNNIDKIRKIYVTGGEPTLIEENYKIMEKIVEIGRAKEVTIMFNTNMTNLRDDFYDLIVKFKNVEMCISIEGYGEIQEYLRYPSNWKQTDKNIRRLASLPSHVQIFAVPVIQSVNLEYTVDFWKYVEDINNEYGYYRIRLLPILLDSPSMSDLGILPLDYKIQCLAKLEDYIKTAKYIMDDPHFVGRYNNIKSKCSSDLYNPKLLKRFKEFTDILDTNRGQSLKSVNPSLYEILENV